MGPTQPLVYGPFISNGPRSNPYQWADIFTAHLSVVAQETILFNGQQTRAIQKNCWAAF